MINPLEAGTESAVRRTVESTAERLRRDGWIVDIEPRVESAELGGFRPDYVARRGDQIIFGEVKYQSDGVMERLQELASQIATIANARLDVTLLGAVEKIRSNTDVDILVERARSLVPVDAAAALLIAWSALEAALSQIDVTELDEGALFMSARQKLSALASLGSVSDTQFMRLDDAAKSRNEVAHGGVVQPALDKIEYVCSVATAFGNDNYHSVEFMVDWFFENYKDPADGVPFESRDGGYIYFAGGPFEASDVLEEHFDLMPSEDIQDALGTINDLGHEWVRVGDY